MRPHQDTVSIAAYYAWQSAGCPTGRDAEFWFAAERRVIEDSISPAPQTNADLSLPRAALPPEVPSPRAA